MANLGIKRARDGDEDALEQNPGQSNSPPLAKRVKSAQGSSLEVAQTSESTCSSEPQPSTEVQITNAEESSQIAASPAASEVNVNSDVNNVCRSETPWFNDGDIILWVENYPDKADASLFRVHRKVLAESRMEPFCTAIDFDIPPAGTPGELFLDGVWVNKYEQQSPSELAILLAWIYMKPTTEKRIQVPLEVIVVLLKRSKIHDHNPVRRSALEYLWNMFPSSLNYHHQVPCFVENCYSDEPSLVYHPGLLHRIIHFVDEYHLVFVLPLLYYYIAQWPLDWITDGLSGREIPDVPPEESDRRYKLPPEHTIKILKLRSLLIEARRDLVFDFIREFSSGLQIEHPTPGCPQTVRDSGATCFAWLMRVQLYLRKEAFIDQPNALEIMNMAQWKTIHKHLCDACAKRVMGFMLRGRDEVWECLPKWFGCKSWEKCLNDQHELEAKIFGTIS